MSSRFYNFSTINYKYFVGVLIVDNLCETIIVVIFNCANLRYRSSSFIESNDDVDSSKTSNSGCRIIARAIANLCTCPPEKLDDEAEITVLKPNGIDKTSFLN